MMPYILLLVLSFILMQKTICSPSLPPRACRCLPDGPCWPSAREWNVLNGTVSGHLFRLRPVGSVCHGAEYDEDVYEAVRVGSESALWRISQPGALIVSNWETLGSNGTCFIDTPREETCNQGRIPDYLVLAESARDVQGAVLFARRHNLHVVIRNTGHDGAGRSSGPGSLQINTSRLKQIRFDDTFVPSGGRHSLGSAVTAGTGLLGIELLEAARTRGLNVVAGVGSSVGVTGGFLLGGGIGLLSPLHGLGSDNTLQFQVVTADRRLVVANHIQNPDLFWALRGGGGGTFGVVVEATIRTFPEVPAILFTLSANLTGETANRSIWDIKRQVAILLPALKRQDDTTSAILVTGMDGDTANLSARILFPNRTDLPATQAQFADFFDAIDALNLPYVSQFTVYPLVSAHLTQPVALRGNYGRVEGSVLISESLFLAPNGTSIIFNLLADLDYEPGDNIEYLMAAGGQVKANKGIVESALLPSWRDSALLISLRRILPATSTAKTLVNNPLPRLRALETPWLGSYLNVGDPEQPDFQEAFWGVNYERLQRVKRRWDRDSLFIVHMGVGSEGWDQEGICWRRV